MSSVMRFDEWQDSNGVPVLDGTGGGLKLGKVLQVVSVVKTDAQAGTLATGAYVAVTNFSPSITPLSATSKLYHFMDLGGGTEVSAKYKITGGVAIAVGDAAGSRERVVAGSGGASERSGPNKTFTFVDTPGGTSTLTYGVEMGNAFQDSRLYSINRGTSDTDSSAASRTTSTWVIMEIEA